MPKKKDDSKRIATAFWERQFSNCLGESDGKHIMIEALQNSGSLHLITKKNFHSFVGSGRCYLYRLMNVDTGSHGRNSDRGTHYCQADNN